MNDSFVSLNESTRYLYALSDVIKIVYFLLSRYIRSLLKIAIIFNLVINLYF